MSKIGFIGAGNMASAIIGGMVARGKAGQDIIASDPNTQSVDKLADQFEIQRAASNSAIAALADTLVLAVKPQVMKQVCTELATAIRPNTLVISIAAGIKCSMLQTWLGENAVVVRCMPNTPALVQLGASGLYADAAISDSQQLRAEEILKSVGIVSWVKEEALIDSITAVSGSGPAYFFLFLEGMVEAGMQLGLDEQTSAQLAIQTAKGAATLAEQSPDSLAELRRKVTSPGGTTEKAIQAFEENDLKRIIAYAMQACAQKSRELADNNS